MKSIGKFIATTLFLMHIICGFAQTPIGGMIDSDTTLSLSDSPFLVESNLVVSDYGHMTIEPGVEIRFSTGTKLEIRGTLIAEGTEADTILFTSNTGNTPSSWLGISVKNNLGGNASIDYCKFQYASTAINEDCCYGGLVSVDHSSFISNVIAIGGYSGDATPVSNCYFYGNTYGLTNADKDVSDCLFENNEYGLFETERINVSNSTFRNHSQVALYGGRGLVSDCIIEDNETGIRAYYEGFEIANSMISNNNVGLEIGSYGDEITGVENSQICNNALYNVKMITSHSTNLFSNCWCETDSTAVENKIYDGYDDPGLGLLSYEIYDDNCENVILTVDKTAVQSNTWTLTNSPYVLTDHYVIAQNETLIIEPGVEVRFANGVQMDVRGTLIAEGTETDTILFTSNTGSTPSSWWGVSVKNTLGGNASIDYCKFEYAQTAVYEDCCNGGLVSIDHSSFISNQTAIGGYSGDATPVSNCYFYGNTYCLTNADKNVSDCLFENNEYGLFETERINVSNSTFRNHSQVALYGGRGLVSNCIIEDNETGIRAFYEGFEIANSTISNNNIGLEIGSYGDEIPEVEDSQICNNALYNVKMNTIHSTDLFSNCWCETDSTAVEDKIYDGYDDPGLGLLSYEIYDDNCENVILTVDKTATQSNTWIVANSPYILTEHYVIAQNETLIIEPGVEVRFANGVQMDVRGTLIAEGTETDTILFTSNTGNTPSSWWGVSVKNTLGGNASIDYCKFEYAQTAVYEDCCYGGLVSIDHSSFISNETAIGGYSGDATPVSNCYFSGNTYCLTSADKDVSDCLFENNEYGLFETERINVSNSTFRNHSEVALYGGRGLVSDCIIESNEIGIKSFFEGFEVFNNNVSFNDIGIVLGNDGSFVAPIDSNMICHNQTYNIKHTNDVDVELFSNCWCEWDSTTVEDKLYDGWDNIDLGLIDYILYSEDCITPIFQTNKREGTVYYFDVNVELHKNSDVVVYPNPASDKLFIETTGIIEEITIRNHTGQSVMALSTGLNANVNIELSILKNGLYIVEIRLSDGQLLTHKIVKRE